jgi:dTDP-4-dehydrorhamnose reductase
VFFPAADILLNGPANTSNNGSYICVMKIVVTGANGFIGFYIVQSLLDKNYTVIATGKGACRLPFTGAGFLYEEMDFTDPYSIDAVFEKHKPDKVVHAGAMGKPDDCELNQAQAYMVNMEGTVHLLINAAEYKSHFIFISTDFVFNGQKGMYNESDERSAVNYYGRTKIEAEDAVMEYEHDWCIVRTVLVYGKPQSGRENILTIVKTKLEHGESYNVFDDQVRTPTYVEDIAAAITTVIQNHSTGIYHISGEDILTPYRMAILTAEYFDLDKTLIKRITASEMHQSALRPLKTGFNISKARNELGFTPTSFKEGLKKTFQ